MSKGILYAVNSAAQTVVNNGMVNFGNIIRRYGNSAGLANGNAFVKDTGYYSCVVNITCTASVAGNVAFSVSKDGSTIAGAQATVSEASGGTTSICIPFVIRECCGCPDYLTVVNTGVEVDAINAAICVEKL